LESQETGLDSLTTAEERRAAASVESARAGLASAQAGLTQARAAKAIVESQIQDRILRAPFSGTIAQIDLQVGETASTAETAAVLVSEGDYEIELQVPEIDIARIQEGMSALITLDAYDDAFTWNGEVVSIEDIETSVEGVPVYITTVRVTNPTDRIKIGMNARAMIVLDQIDDTVAIPQSYLFTEDSRNYVLQQIDDDRVVEKTVKTGLRGANSLVQITAGLEAGEIIVREQQSD
jgi:HlyD family secretion protein